MHSITVKGPRLSDEIERKIAQKYIDPLRKTGGRIPTNRALASEFRVTPATISKALRQLQTSGRVRALVGSGTYVNPAPASSVTQGVYYSGSFFDGQLHNRIYALLDHQFQLQAEAMGRGVRHYIDSNANSASDLSPALIGDAAAGRVDGLLVVTSRMRSRQALLDLPVPTVGFNDSFSHGGVFVDLYEFARQAVETLARSGKKRIALISPLYRDGAETSSRYGRLIDGFADGMKEAGLPVKPARIAEPTAPPGDFVDYGKEAFRKAWGQPGTAEKPDAMVVFPDACAIGAKTVALELGIADQVQLAVLENKENPWPILADCVRFQLRMTEVIRRAMHALDLAVEEKVPSTLFVQAHLLAEPDAPPGAEERLPSFQ